MSDVNVLKLLKRIDSLFSSSERSQNETVYSDLSEYLLPNQSGIFNRNGKASSAAGEKKTKRLYNSFPIDCAQKLTAALQSILTNAATNWFKLKAVKEELNNDPEVLKFLDDVTKLINNDINDSNFYTETPKAYQQYVVLGSMAIFHEEKEATVPGRYPGYKFTAIHLSQIAWAENKDGLVDKVAYRFELTAEQAFEKWGTKCSKKILDALETNPDNMFEFVLWLAPRDKSEVKLNEMGLAAPKERPFASMYIDVQAKQIIEESGYYEFPMYCPRWDMLPGERYGRGRGHLALGDIRAFNKISSQMEKSFDKDVDPPLFVNRRDILGALSMNPGARSVVENVDGIKEFVSQGRTDRIFELFTQYKENIKSMFFIDQILLPPREDIGQMREAEVLHRIKQIHTVFGPIVPRIGAEFLSPFLLRCFKMRLRANALPPLPEAIKKQGLDLEIVFMNELATSQKLAVVTNNQQFMQQIGIVAQFSPSSLDVVDFDDILLEDARAMSISEKSLRTDDEIKQIRDERAKAQQAAQQLQAANLAADTAVKAKGAQPDGAV